MKKKISLFVLLFVISLNAFAFIPLLFAGSRIVAAGIATPTGQLWAAGTVMAIGTLAQSVYFSRLGTDGSTRTDTIYTTTADRPASPQELGAGFTNGYPHVIPPPTSSPQMVYYNYAGVTFSTQVDACYSTLHFMYPSAAISNIAVSVAATPSVDGRCSYINNGTPAYLSPVYASVSCPTGYSPSGATCGLSTPDVVVRPSDGFCPIIRNGSSYSADMTDPDCSGGNSTPQFMPDGSFTISSSDGHTMSGTGFTSAGVGTIVDSKPNADGTTTKTTTTLQGTGTPTTTPPAVSGVKQEVTAGTGAGNTGVPVSSSPNVDLSGLTAAEAATAAAIQAQTIAQAAQAAQVEQDRANDRLVPFTGESIPTSNIPVSISSVSFASNAACPQPVSTVLFGRTYAISYTPLCDYASMRRPLFLAFGAFTATFIFIGGLKA